MALLLAGVLGPFRGSLRRSNRRNANHEPWARRAPGFFDASPQAPEPWTRPDAPEHRTEVRGSFDSRPRTDRQPPPTNRDEPRSHEP